MAANIFGLSYFEPWKGISGDLKLPSGSTLHFSYRMFIHRGDAHEANVASRYIDYIYPPMVEVRKKA